ncbi:uncharacterized protein LOC143213638 [Lasioglossum baleicum]|uniref:uncharacterized protein LOC143213638 n=1 Tax=Lasioglossum baleicum TaxID=434251 RepID=UPI003FCC57E2
MRPNQDRRAEGKIVSGLRRGNVTSPHGHKSPPQIIAIVCVLPIQATFGPSTRPRHAGLDLCARIAWLSGEMPSLSGENSVECHDVKLKEILRNESLQTSGTKSELIARLIEHDPSCQWAYRGQTDTVNENAGGDVYESHTSGNTARNDDAVDVRREIILLNREREIAERELELTRRELALIQETRRSSGAEHANPREENTHGRVGVKTVAELLAYFDGKSEDYPTWVKQIKVLRRTYKLNDNETKVLIGMRVRGKARDWVHSRSEYIELLADDLLSKLEQMFYHRPSNLVLRDRLRERVWKKNESFEDYFHDKIIKANRIPIDDEVELVDHIIEGIPDRSLRSQAKMHCFKTPEALLVAFEQLMLPSTSFAGNSLIDERRRLPTTQQDREAFRKDKSRRCFNCNTEGHLSADCPAKSRGPKCFRCGQHGHLAPNCSKRDTGPEKTVKLVTRFPSTQSCKAVRLNNVELMSIIDTASDLTLMSASCLVKIGAPCLQISGTTFAGVGSNGHKTLGKFRTSVVIDEHAYEIEFHVVSDILLKHDLLLGADFLNKVKLVRNGREITIEKIREDPVTDKWCDEKTTTFSTSRKECDYRKLNQKIVRDRYPLPLVEDQLDALQGAKLFSTLDLRNGFFHVPVHKDSRKFTSFVVPNAVFVRFINMVFRDLLQQKVILAYMDDIIVPSSDLESGIQKLEQVLAVASDHGLEINWKKCSWLRSKVEFLGHIVENGSVRPSEGKTAAVAKFPVPKNAKQVQSFLGLTGYFRKFIEGYSTIARPLKNLLRAGVTFELDGTAIGAFDLLKTKLMEKPVLNIYKVDAETELHTDASSFGFGAVLMQRSDDDNKFHPIYFASGKTTPAEARYASYELEQN